MKNACLYILLLMVPFSLLSNVVYGLDNNEILSTNTHVWVRDGKEIVVDTVLIRINNQYGEEKIQIGYDKISRLKSLKAYIEDLHGNRIRELSSTEYLNRSVYQESSLYSDLKERVFRPNHQVYPYCLRYVSIHVAGEFIQLVHWTPAGRSDQPYRKANLYLHLPKGYQTRCLVQNVTDIRTDTVKEGLITRYSVNPPQLNEQQYDKTFQVSTRPLVWIVPLCFRYGVDGSNLSWSGFGNWMAQLNKDLTKLPEHEVNMVHQLTQGLPDTLAIVRSLYHYMQDHTRYINVTLGIGGMKSYPAEYVAINKYGDCKALTNYMKALLECAGVRSHMVLVNSSLYPDIFFKEFPTSQFNHVVLLVPIGKDTIWLENTSSILPMGYLGASTHNRPGLLIDTQKSHLIHTPSLNQDDVSGTRAFEVQISPLGNASIHWMHTGRGSDFEYFSFVKENIPVKSQLEYLDRYIPFKHYEPVVLNLNKKNRDSFSCVFEAKVEISNYCYLESERIYLPQIPIFKGLQFFPKPGLDGFQIGLPIAVTDTVEYYLPECFQWEKLPEKIVITCPSGTFSMEYSSTGNQIRLLKKFILKEGLYSAESYQNVYTFYSQVKDAEKATIILKSK
jgi:hypothetical protein